MSTQQKLPIGVFDSGLGGLTVVRALSRHLPQENILYVGDTARVPYGTKSPETIRRYALQISFFLIQKKVKTIVVACNTASAVALKALKSLPIPVVGVIEPGARAAVRKASHLNIGVIGTPATVASHAYRNAIRRTSPRAEVTEVACPLFVPLVEEGWTAHTVTKQVTSEYLAPLIKKKIDTLVLGCTHYPLLKDTIRSVVGNKIALIDSAEETAVEVESLLKKSNGLNELSRRGKVQCFVTDNPKSFSKLSRRFFGESLGSARRLSFESL